MVKILKQIIFAVVIAMGTVPVYNATNIGYIRWSIIGVYMFFAIALAEIILKEEPGELFDNFTIENWKKAKISSVFMIVATISVIKTLICLYTAIMNNR